MVKMFTKVICKKMTFLAHLQCRLHSKLNLFGEEKWKTFISFVGKVVNIFSIAVLSGRSKIAQRAGRSFSAFGGLN